MPRNGKQKLWVNLLLCVASVSIFLGGAELLARLRYSPHTYQYYGIFEYDDEKVFGLKPNNQDTYWEGNFTTNEFGHRTGASTYTKEKPDGTKRILVVGDSISFGHGVDDDQTFSFHLDQALNSRKDLPEENISFEVINTAVPGNSPFQEYTDTKRGLEFQPDVVILQVTLNDIIEQSAGWILRAMDFDEGMMEVDSREYILGFKKMSGLDYMLRQHSALYLFLKDMTARIRFRDPTGKHIAEKAKGEENYSAALLISEPESAVVERAYEQAFKSLQRIADLTKEQGVPLIIIITPFNFQLGLEPEIAFPQQKIAAFAEENGAHHIDLLPILRNLLEETVGEGKTANELIAEMRKTGSNKIWDFWNIFFLDYDHLSPTGHEMVARVLEPVVLHYLRAE